jgi:aminomethyltransferase
MAYVGPADAGARRARLLRPGDRSLPPGCERYRVAGGGSAVLELKPGDRLRVVDLEGRQPCELFAFGVDGRADGGLIGAESCGDAAGTRALLAGDAAAKLRRALERHGLSLAAARAVEPFDPDSRAGQDADFQAQAAVRLLVTAPGGPMSVEAQTPPTDLEVFVERAEPTAPSTPGLPDPLAEPRQDLRVERATAAAFEVKAGEWIQIIDVEGRQCSDLQAFPLAQLDKGIERCLDVTTTRTLLGHGYPHPGLHAKYYDQDFQPLVEIVQDNCSRHDTFGLACFAKYYEDRGYPGHANCSDNFNRALAPYGVQPRRGWMAMNFFYNTGIDEHNQFHLDEPWSRAGDFVLVRALTDLVCVSSACPDDIDAANGWNPSDIHVRVYGPEQQFKRSIGFRKTTEAEVEMTKETGFHSRTSALTRNFVEYNGYWMASSYTNHGPIAEYWACREKAIVMDLTPLRKFEVLGPDAETLMQHCLTRNVRKLAVGQVVYTAMCYDTGTMIDDGTLFRLGPDNFRWIGGSDYGGQWLREQAEKLGLEVWIKSSTDQLHNLAVQGPNSRDILKQVVWTPPHQPSLEELAWFRFTIGRLGEADGLPIIVSRTGYTGELGYEVFCHPRDGGAVWDAIWQAGQPLGLTPLGLEALDMLRIEAGLIFAGYDFDDQTDPFEAGIGFTVPLKSKEEDFIGKAALIKRKETPQRVMVGLELEGEEPAVHGDCVRLGRHQVGVVTSATRSPILGKNVALCRMAVEHAAAGTEVEVGKLDGLQKRLPATVVPLSFYDPKKERPRT